MFRFVVLACTVIWNLEFCCSNKGLRHPAHWVVRLASSEQVGVPGNEISRSKTLSSREQLSDLAIATRFLDDALDDVNANFTASERNSLQPLVAKANESVQILAFDDSRQGPLLFAGTTSRVLAGKVAARLDGMLGDRRISYFADGEIDIELLTSVRGKEVYILQSIAKYNNKGVNDALVELLLLITTMRRSSARRITAIVPYFAYGRQDRKPPGQRGPIAAADVARFVEAAGADRVMAVDLHCGQLAGFFSPKVPCDNLAAGGEGVRRFAEKLKAGEIQNPVVVSPDASGVGRAKEFRQGLLDCGADETGFAMLIEHSRNRLGDVKTLELVGDVNLSDAIVVDDMIDTGETLCAAATKLISVGARRVYAFATHGLFNGAMVENIRNSQLHEVIVCDTVELTEQASAEKKIKQITIASLLSEAITAAHDKESLSAHLFKDRPAPAVHGDGVHNRRCYFVG